MIFIGKTAFYKRGESDRSRKRFKKNNIINPFFFINNNPLPIFSLIFSPVPPLIPPLIPSPIPSFPSSLIFLSPSSGSLIIPPLILFPDSFYDTRP